MLGDHVQCGAVLQFQERPGHGGSKTPFVPQEEAERVDIM